VSDPGPESFADAFERAHPHVVPPRVWWATALQVLGRIWVGICTLIILYVLAGHLPEEGFGTLTFYLAVFAWLDALAMLGTSQVAVQRTAGDPASVPAVLKAARRIRLGAGTLGVVLVGGGAIASGESGALWILLASLYPLTHALELSATVFRNRIAWSVPVAVRLVASGLSLGFVLLAWWGGVDSPAFFLVAIAAGSALGNLVLHLASLPHLPRVVGPIAAARGLLRDALPMGLAGLCAHTYFYVDNLFVRHYEGEAALGQYNVAVRFLSVMIMVAQYASLTALPWFARRHEAGELASAVQRLGPPLFAAAGLGAGLLWPFATDLLELFREGFGAAGPSMRWLLLAVVAIHAGGVLMTALVAAGGYRGVLVVTAAGLLVNLLGNLWSVPRYGMEGAAAITFVTEAFVVIGCALALRGAGVRLELRRSWPWLGAPVAFFLGLGLSHLLLLALP